MGIIGSHVEITSGWRGHQANIEVATGAMGISRRESAPPVTATQASTGSAARRPVATPASAVASRLIGPNLANAPIPLYEWTTIHPEPARHLDR